MSLAPDTTNPNANYKTGSLSLDAAGLNITHTLDQLTQSRNDLKKEIQ
jgi:hypothetical protein